MNPEIQKLIEFAILDGEISPKDREILKKKAEKMGKENNKKRSQNPLPLLICPLVINNLLYKAKKVTKEVLLKNVLLVEQKLNQCR